jgi:hypothetical protein
MRIEGTELTNTMLLQPIFERCTGMSFTPETQTFVMQCTFEQLAKVYNEGHIVIDEDGIPYEKFSDIDVKVDLYSDIEFCQITLSRRPPVAN